MLDDAGKLGESMVPVATPCRAGVHEVLPDRQLFSDEEPTPYYEPEDLHDGGDYHEHHEPPISVKKTPEKSVAAVESVPHVPPAPAQPQPKKGPRQLTRQELPRDTCMRVEIHTVFFSGGGGPSFICHPPCGLRRSCT